MIPGIHDYWLLDSTGILPFFRHSWLARASGAMFVALGVRLAISER